MKLNFAKKMLKKCKNFSNGDSGFIGFHLSLKLSSISHNIGDR